MFYEQWEHLDSNLAVTTAKLQSSNNENDTIHQLQLTNYENFPITAFFGIGFTHHCAILTGVKALQERLFYIQLCFNQSLTVEGIQQRISEDAYHNQGKMSNNFAYTMPDYKQAFQAIQVFKDSYLLDFINTEQLGQREEDIDERVIEKTRIVNFANCGCIELHELTRPLILMRSPALFTRLFR